MLEPVLQTFRVDSGGVTHTVTVALEWFLAYVTSFCPMKLLLCFGSKRAPRSVAKVSKRLYFTL